MDLGASPRAFSKKQDGFAYRLVFSTVCACSAALSFGFVIGYSSSAIPQLEGSGLLSGQHQSGWFGSLLTVGAMVGGPAAGWCIEKLGRRDTIKLSSLPFFAGWLCIVFASGAGALYTGRLLCGIASGMVTVAVPVYIAEVSSKNLRGTLGAGTQLSITVGILAAYSLVIPFNWLTMAMFGLGGAVITFLLMFAIPETPRWLLMNGKKTEAILALKQLRHQHADCEDECRDIEEGLDVKETFTWSEFKKAELSRPLIISVIIMVFQQFSGINAVMFYTVSIFDSAGLEESELATVLVGAVQVVATCVACFLVDRMGRRRLLIIAGCLMCLSCFSLGIYYMYMAPPPGSTSSENGTYAVISLIVYIIGFSLGWGPIPMLIMSEIFPSRVRGAASSIAILTNWASAFIVTSEFMTIQNLIGPGMTFWLFAFSCMASAVYVWKKVPETKGKSLEDIELFFLGKSMLY